MLTEEQFEKMDLNLIFTNNEIIEDIDSFKNRHLIYVIKNEDVFYVGMSSNIRRRLDNHIKRNKNNLNWGGEVYILDECSWYGNRCAMETIWIAWFDANATIINIQKPFNKIKNGKVNTSHIKNTNYEKFLNNEIIEGISLITPKTAEEKFMEMMSA